MLRKALILMTALVGIWAPPAQAQTVDDIVKRGELRVGIQLTIPPFGFKDEALNPQGLDVDVANLLAREMNVKLNIVQLTGPNRIPFLTSNKVDMVIAGLSITSERAKAIIFSNPYYMIDQVILAPKSKSIRSLADLKGMKVGVARASTNDTVATTQSPQGTTIQRFEDEATNVQALVSGQIDAVVTSGLFALEVARKFPDLGLDASVTLSRAPVAVGLRKEDTALLQWVNTALFVVSLNGEMAKVNRKWLASDNALLPTF